VARTAQLLRDIFQVPRLAPVPGEGVEGKPETRCLAGESLSKLSVDQQQPVRRARLGSQSCGHCFIRQCAAAIEDGHLSAACQLGQLSANSLVEIEEFRASVINGGPMKRRMNL